MSTFVSHTRTYRRLQVRMKHHEPGSLVRLLWYNLRTGWFYGEVDGVKYLFDDGDLGEWLYL